MNLSRIVLFSLILFLNCLPQSRNLNLVLLIDDGQEPQNGGPYTADLVVALSQKASSILVSETILYFFLSTKKKLEEFPGHLKKLPKQELSKLPKKISNLLNEIWKILPIIYDLNNLLDHINKLKEILAKLDAYKIEQEFIGKIRTAIEKLEKHIADNPQSYAKLGEHEYTQSIEIINSISQLFNELNNALIKLQSSIPNYLNNKFYTMFIFNLNEWHIYKHAQAPLYLLIPKIYEEQTKKEYEAHKASLKELEKKRAELEQMKATMPEAEYKKQLEMLELVSVAPKERKTEGETKAVKEYSAREMALGLKVDHANLLTPLTFTTPNDLLNFIARDFDQKAGMAVFLAEPPAFAYKELKQFFVEGRSSEFGSWLIYMGGHGIYATIPEHIELQIEEKLRQFKKLLGKVQTNLQALNQPELKVVGQETGQLAKEYNKLFIAYLAVYAKESIFSPEAEEAEHFLDMLNNKDTTLESFAVSNQLDWEKLINKQNLANYLTMIIDVLTKMTKQETMISTEEKTKKEREITTAFIAGLPYEEFRDFIHFLSRSMHTSFLYVLTCFGGGFIMQQIIKYVQILETEEQQILKSVSPGFIIAMGALPDVSVAGTRLSESTPNFDNFFADLRKFFSRAMPFKEDPIKTILKNIALRGRGESIKGGFEEWRHGISSVASVYFPGGKLIHTPEIDKEIMVLTKAKLKALELVIPGKKERVEKKVEPIDTRGKSAVLIYPTEIHAPVILGFDSKKQATALVPMISNQVHFDLIDTTKNDKPLTLKIFLEHSIVDTRPVIPRIFTIKRLLCNNYKKSGLKGDILELSDVLIKSTISFQPKTENIIWNVLFTLNGKIFHGTMIDEEDEEGRFITNPEWKEITQEEAEKMRKET